MHTSQEAALHHSKNPRCRIHCISGSEVLPHESRCNRQDAAMYKRTSWYKVLQDNFGDDNIPFSTSRYQNRCPKMWCNTKTGAPKWDAVPKQVPQNEMLLRSACEKDGGNQESHVCLSTCSRPTLCINLLDPWSWPCLSSVYAKLLTWALPWRCDLSIQFRLAFFALLGANKRSHCPDLLLIAFWGCLASVPVNILFLSVFALWRRQSSWESGPALFSCRSLERFISSCPKCCHCQQEPNMMKGPKLGCLASGLSTSSDFHNSMNQQTSNIAECRTGHRPEVTLCTYNFGDSQKHWGALGVFYYETFGWWVSAQPSATSSQWTKSPLDSAQQKLYAHEGNCLVAFCAPLAPWTTSAKDFATALVIGITTFFTCCGTSEDTEVVQHEVACWLWHRRYRVQIQGCSVLSLMLLIVGPLQNPYLKMKSEICNISSFLCCPKFCCTVQPWQCSSQTNSGVPGFVGCQCRWLWANNNCTTLISTQLFCNWVLLSLSFVSQLSGNAKIRL